MVNHFFNRCFRRLSVLFVCSMVVFPMGAALPFPAYQKVLFIGAHPDDNESCCGGTMIRMQQEGIEVVSVYFTSGEAGIKGKTYEEAARIRRAELRQACEVMKVRYVLLSQIDGNTVINEQAYREMDSLIRAEKPDAVFTHWPIDGHADHRVCSNIVMNAWMRTRRNFDLYYFEAETGHQSRNFNPEIYVNITDVADKKHEALNCHVSQHPDLIMADWHNDMELYRGKESEYTRAEAFVLQKGTRH